MGSSPSKMPPRTTLDEKAVERLLRSFQLGTESPEPGFVLVDNDDGDDEKMAGTDARLARRPEGLPVHLLGSWQSRLLEDPKNRSVYLCTHVP